MVNAKKNVLATVCLLLAATGISSAAPGVWYYPTSNEIWIVGTENKDTCSVYVDDCTATVKIFGNEYNFTLVDTNPNIVGFFYGGDDSLVFLTVGVPPEYAPTSQIWFGDGKDSFVGTEGVDQIWGEGGVDTIYTVGGNDYIDGGDGNDNLYSGTGSDTVNGGSGSDTLNQGGAADYKVLSVETLTNPAN